MIKISRLGVFSFARFQALLAGLLGLLAGVLYSFGGLVIDALVTAGILDAAAMSTSGLSKGTLLAFGALLGMPVLFALGGFIVGILGARVFNVFARRFQGLRLDVTLVQ